MAVGAHALCSLADVRLALESQTGETARDALLEELIDTASRVIMRETRREFAPAGDAGETRTVAWFREFGRTINLDPWDIRAVTAVVVNPDTTVETAAVVGTDVTLAPLASRDGVYWRLMFGRTFAPAASDAEAEFGAALVRITGTWGWATVPDDVRRAAVLTVCSWAQSDAAAFALQGLDEPRQIAPPAPERYSIPPAAWRMLSAHAHRAAF